MQLPSKDRYGSQLSERKSLSYGPADVGAAEKHPGVGMMEIHVWKRHSNAIEAFSGSGFSKAEDNATPRELRNITPLGWSMKIPSRGIETISQLFFEE